MTELAVPEGRRFSLVYMRTDERLKDSERMRFRLAKVVRAMAPRRNDGGVDFGRFVEAELGVGVVEVFGLTSVFDVEKVFMKAAIRDVLDMITLLAHFLSPRRVEVANFVNRVRRIFAETQVGYRIDDKGGVHPAFDDSFETVRGAAIAGLGGPDHGAERGFIEDAERALMEDPIDGRQAIRCIFDAVENLFKKMYPGVTHLNSAAISGKLRPEVEAAWPGAEHQTQRSSSLKSVDSFRQWVDGAHFYRHAPGAPEPKQPSEDHTILTVSQGLSFLRWLAKIQAGRS